MLLIIAIGLGILALISIGSLLKTQLRSKPNPPLENISQGHRESEMCRDCHKTEYDLWVNSNHGLAERSLRPEMDRVAFEPARAFRHGSQTTQLDIREDEYQIITMGFKTNVEPNRVERVIGHNPLRQFLTAGTRGRFQVQEASYDPKSNQWFNVYGEDDRQTGEWGHWTGRGMNWNSRCAECHNTRLRKNYDEASDGYRTTMAEMSVGCEACHGSLKAHAQWRKANPNAKQDPTITRLSPTRIVSVCATCHARQDNLTESFQPGDAFFDHYSLETVEQADRWYPDGQIHDEDYEFASLLSSRMYQRGVRCLDCHNAHSMKNHLTGNGLCMRCHNGSFTNAPAINPADHGHHKLADKGGECVGCHMPVTVYMQRHPRHDHGFTIPDPLLTKQLGIPNACNRCHADQNADWALDYVEKWYGAKMDRHTRDRAQWIAAAQKGEAIGRDHLITMLKLESPYWRAVAAGLLADWTDDPAVQTALLARLKDEHPLVREKAVRSLENFAAKKNKQFISAIQPLLDDPARNVRIAAAWVLKATVDMQSRSGRELQKAMDLNADQPMGQYQKAVFLLARQEPKKALSHLQKAVEWDSYSPPFRCKLAEVFSQLGHTTEALAAVTPAKTLVPNDPRMPYARAAILARMGRINEARWETKRVLELQPDYEPAQKLLRSLAKDSSSVSPHGNNIAR